MEASMKIVIPGGSGQVGTVLARAFHGDGHDVVVLSRRPDVRPWPVVGWDGATLGAWRSELDGADVVINLAAAASTAGTLRPTGARFWNRACHRRARSGKRSLAPRGRRASGCRRAPPRSTQRFDAPNDEGTGILGGSEPSAPSAWRFSIDVARAWERAFDEARTDGTRKVALRSAMTLSPDRGGVFDTLVGLVRRGLGGSAGSGQQFMSWIHDEDFVAAVRWLIDRDDVDGVVNVASPNPVPNAEFMRILREAFGVSVGLPAAEWMLEIGAVFMRTETELILKSRRVVPARLLEHGFAFKFPEWQEAASDLFRRWSDQRRRAA